MKMIGQPQMVAEFDAVGLGQWFRYATGAIEAVGHWYSFAPKCNLGGGAALLTGVAVGVFFAQLLKIHGDVVHPVVFAALLAWIAYRYRPIAAA